MMNACCTASSDAYDFDGSTRGFEQLTPVDEQSTRVVVTFRCAECSTGWRRSQSLENGTVVWEKLTTVQPS
ncbi:hypothetical protein PPC_3514 [Pseudomonas protegens Cab57]|nr:hypothetical protein PPC_3514 [Pseudomonas protegens Cab57]